MSILFWVIWTVACASLSAALLLIGCELLSANYAEGRSVIAPRVKDDALFVTAIGAALVVIAHFIIGILYVTGLVT